MLLAFGGGCNIMLRFHTVMITISFFGYIFDANLEIASLTGK